MRADYLARFDLHLVGGRIHREYGIPAEQFAEFNAHLVGLIEVIAEFQGPEPTAGAATG